MYITDAATESEPLNETTSSSVKQTCREIP